MKEIDPNALDADPVVTEAKSFVVFQMEGRDGSTLTVEIRGDRLPSPVEVVDIGLELIKKAHMLGVPR